MKDLSLIPIDDLIDEIEKRCETFVCSYRLTGAEEIEMRYCRYGKGTWFDSVGLATMLQNDCMNNWNSELRTLQRINNDEDD